MPRRDGRQRAAQKPGPQPRPRSHGGEWPGWLRRRRDSRQWLSRDGRQRPSPPPPVHPVCARVRPLVRLLFAAARGRAQSLLYRRRRAMPSYRELLARARAETSEITVEELRVLLTDRTPLTVLDVREADEFAEGRIPGAVLLPRGVLEQQVEALVPR